MAYVDVKTFTGETMTDVYFAQVDRNNVLFSDGSNGLWCYPGYGIATETGYRVLDLVPFLPDNNGGAGISIATPVPFAPDGKYLTWHRGRLFMADPITSTVYYSGTRTDYDRNDKDSFTPAHDADTPIKPWELWNVKLDLSRANVGHGASMVIGKPDEQITGLADSEEGLWVFKDNQILLWTWPDSAAPHEVTQGADVSEIAQNVGLIAYRTLVKDRGNMLFLGMVENEEYKLFVMSGGEISPITVNVDSVMHSVVNPKLSRAAMHGSYYILFADTGSGVLPYMAVNVDSGAIVELTGPKQDDGSYYPFDSVIVWDNLGKVLIGSGDTILRYPGDALNPVDDNGTYYNIETQRMDAGKPFHENKFRKVWVGVDTLASDGSIAVRDEDITVEVEYDDDSDTFDLTASGRDVVSANLNKRSNSAVVRAYGTADGSISINDIGVAVRDRTTR